MPQCSCSSLRYTVLITFISQGWCRGKRECEGNNRPNSERTRAKCGHCKRFPQPRVPRCRQLPSSAFRFFHRDVSPYPVNASTRAACQAQAPQLLPKTIRRLAYLQLHLHIASSLMTLLGDRKLGSRPETYSRGLHARPDPFADHDVSELIEWLAACAHLQSGPGMFSHGAGISASLPHPLCLSTSHNGGTYRSRWIPKS